MSKTLQQGNLSYSFYYWIIARNPEINYTKNYII